MVFKDLCVLVLQKKVASALEGLVSTDWSSLLGWLVCSGHLRSLGGHDVLRFC